MAAQLPRISRLELKNGGIEGTIPGRRCRGRCGGGTFLIDLPPGSPYSIEDLVSGNPPERIDLGASLTSSCVAQFDDLKKAWENARREVHDGDDEADSWSDEDDDFASDSEEDDPLVARKK